MKEPERVFTKHLSVGACLFVGMIDLANENQTYFEVVNHYPPLDMRVYTVISKECGAFS